MNFDRFLEIFSSRGGFGLVRAMSGLFPGPFGSGGLEGLNGLVEFLHGGVGEAKGVEGKAVHKGGECEG